MEDNWLALYLCIVRGCTSDKALALMHIKTPKRVKPYKLKERQIKLYKYIEDPIKLIDLKKIYTYDQIAKMYNTYPHRIYNDIRHYKQTAAVQ